MRTWAGRPVSSDPGVPRRDHLAGGRWSRRGGRWWPTNWTFCKPRARPITLFPLIDPCASGCTVPRKGRGTVVCWQNAVVYMWPVDFQINRRRFVRRRWQCYGVRRQVNLCICAQRELYELNFFYGHLTCLRQCTVFHTWSQEFKHFLWSKHETCNMARVRKK